MSEAVGVRRPVVRITLPEVEARIEQKNRAIATGLGGGATGLSGTETLNHILPTVGGVALTAALAITAVVLFIYTLKSVQRNPPSKAALASAKR